MTQEYRNKAHLSEIGIFRCVRKIPASSGIFPQWQWLLADPYSYQSINDSIVIAIHIGGMARACRTCQHLKRPDIDRRLAAGEPLAQVAHGYGLNVSSLHRHRTNCLKLGSSNAIKKEAAQGTAAVTLLPSRENLGGAYLDLRNRIDQIVAQAQHEGSLSVAVSGLNSLRQTLDSLARLSGHDRAAGTQVNVAVQTNVQFDAGQIAERLIQRFDQEPDVKARIARALMEIDHEQSP